MKGFRSAAIATMVLVTAWSFWAWAQTTPAPSSRHDMAAPGSPEVTAAHGEPASDSASPPAMNWTRFGEETPPFVAMVANFGILMAGYYFFGRKPVAAALQNRRDTISKEIDEAQRMKHEAEERAKIYQAKLAKLEEEVHAAREALARAADAERDRIVAEAEAKAERLRKDAQFLVEQEIKQLRQDLWRDAVEAAVTAAGDLLKEKITGEDQQRLADDYIADLSAQKAAAAPAGERAP